MKEPLIRLENVQAGYDGKQVLRDINLTVYDRDFLGIVGPNGGGKTTLIKTILGLTRPMSGTITCFRDGRPVPSLRMGYLPQCNKTDRDFPVSVYEVVLSGLRKGFLKRYGKAQHQAVRDILRRMGLEAEADTPIGRLSGGQLQRTLLARAVVSRPEVVILDEPDTYMDNPSETALYRLLEEINRESAVILVSHDMGAVLRNVRSIACVDKTLDYHSETEPPEDWLEDKLGCPIDLIGHGNYPHRILKYHKHS